jgi:HK97 family phage portal protein
MSVKPDEAQFLEARRYTAGEVANLYGVPLEFVGDGVSNGAAYVTGVSMRFRMWYLTGLLPRITRIEDAFTSLLPRGVYAKFNTNSLLRMDPEQQTAFFAAGQLGEYMTRNEIRALLDMNPIEGGDEFLHSVQWQENAPPDDGGTDDSTEPAPAGSPVKEPEE